MLHAKHDGLYPKIKDKLDVRDNDIVFYTGSLVQGVGNDYSDVDLIIIVEDKTHYNKIESDFNNEYMRARYLYINDINIDIEYWSRDFVEEVINDNNSINFHNAKRKISSLFSLNFAEVIHRILTGFPIAQESEFEAVRSSINNASYFEWQFRNCLNDLDNAYDDAIGNLNANKLETAYIISEHVLLKSMKCLLFNRRVSLDRDKWIYDLFSRQAITDSVIEEIHRKIYKLLFNCSIRIRTEMEEIVRERLVLSQMIVESAQPHGERHGS